MKNLWRSGQCYLARDHNHTTMHQPLFLRPPGKLYHVTVLCVVSGEGPQPHHHAPAIIPPGKLYHVTVLCVVYGEGPQPHHRAPAIIPPGKLYHVTVLAGIIVTLKSQFLGVFGWCHFYKLKVITTKFIHMNCHKRHFWVQSVQSGSRSKKWCFLYCVTTHIIYLVDSRHKISQKFTTYMEPDLKSRICSIISCI